MSELDEIFPVARIKVFTGEYKLYTNMYELDKEIKEVDVYSKEQVLKLLEPQLTIPKSIAEMLDEELNPLKRESMLETFVLGLNYLVLSDELMKFVLTGNNYHVISAYLAGKALGVDLVKVVEG